MESPISLASVLGTAFAAMIGLVIWLIKKTFETTIPDMQRAFDAHISALRTADADASKDERDLFREQISEERKMCREEFAILASGIKENQDIANRHIEVTRELIGRVLVNQLQTKELEKKVNDKI